MAGVGHFAPEEDPSAFTTVVGDWLADPGPEQGRAVTDGDRPIATATRPAGPGPPGRATASAGRCHAAAPTTSVERVPDDLVLPPLESLAEAQRLLDAGRPFHAHEVLEGTWKAAPEHERELWQGLAQLAVGLTHRARGNPVGRGPPARAGRRPGRRLRPASRRTASTSPGWSTPRAAIAAEPLTAGEPPRTLRLRA